VARGIRPRERPDGDIAKRQTRHDRDTFVLELMRTALRHDARRREEAEQIGEFAQLIRTSVAAHDFLEEIDIGVQGRQLRAQQLEPLRPIGKPAPEVQAGHAQRGAAPAHVSQSTSSTMSEIRIAETSRNPLTATKKANGVALLRPAAI